LKAFIVKLLKQVGYPSIALKNHFVLLLAALCLYCHAISCLPGLQNDHGCSKAQYQGCMHPHCGANSNKIQNPLLLKNIDIFAS